VSPSFADCPMADERRRGTKKKKGNVSFAYFFDHTAGRDGKKIEKKEEKRVE